MGSVQFYIILAKNVGDNWNLSAGAQDKRTGIVLTADFAGEIMRPVFCSFFDHIFFSFDGCANVCAGGSPKERTQSSLDQEPKESIKKTTKSPSLVNSDPAPTTYRPAGYNYPAPLIGLDLAFKKPARPPPGLPTLYEPPQ